MNEVKKIPDGWLETALSDIALVNPRESISKGSITINIPMDCIDSFSKKIQRYNSKGFEGGTKFRNGDTLLARITPCLENGKTAFVDILNENEIGFGSTEYLVFREIKEKSDKHFIYYLSISPRFREIAIKAMSGTSGRQRVQTDMLVNHKFYLPQYTEQKSIASILSAFDDKIELLQAQNKTLEETAQTIFEEWFGKYSVDDELPYGFTKVTLKEIIKSANTGLDAIKRAPIVEEETGIKCFRIQDASQKKDYSNWGNTNVEQKNYQRFKLLKGDILIARTGNSIGVNYLVKEDLKSVFNNGIIRLRVNPKSNYLFLYMTIISKMFERHIQSISYGTSTQPNMQINSLLSYELILPPSDKQNSFETILIPIFEKQKINQIQIQTIIKTRNELLPRLMSGEVRVKM